MSVAALPALMAFANTTHAATSATYNLNTVINGTLVPGTTSTWASATFQDIVGGVSLTLNISNTLASNPDTVGTFISEWYFNFDSTKTINSSSITGQTGTFLTPTVNISDNLYDPANFSGSPDNFDIRIAFAGSPYGPTGTGSSASRRFGVGESVTFNLLGSGVTTDSFNFLNNTPPSAPPNEAGAGIYHGVAEVQGFLINGVSTSSTYGAVPEPSAGILSMLTAAACTVFSRKRRDLKA